MNAAKHILIADDDDDIAFVVRFMLEREGYRVSHINDDQIIKHLTQNAIDLIILDLNLAGINGGTLCQQLKSSEWTRNIPVVLFSASPDIKEAMSRYCADDYLEKPFDLQFLVKKVNNLLNMQRMAS